VISGPSSSRQVRVVSSNFIVNPRHLEPDSDGSSSTIHDFLLQQMTDWLADWHSLSEHEKRSYEAAAAVLDHEFSA
jgi:hypothetical protein